MQSVASVSDSAHSIQLLNQIEQLVVSVLILW